MKKKTLYLSKFRSESALKLSEYRKFAKSWKPDPLLSNIFNRLSKGKSKYRLYVSPTKGVIDLTTKIPSYIEKHIKAKGFNVSQLDYIRGYATDKHGRQVKLGKILSDNPGYLDLFVQSEGRKRDLQVLDREKYVLAVSHHAYDIVGASTDRGWTSCTDLRGGYAATAPTRIKPEVDNRSIIVYLVRKEDSNIQKPLARALAKRFVSDAGSERYLVDAIYPNKNPLLLKTVQGWLDRNINKHLPTVANDFTLFTLPESQYKDGHSNTDGEEGVSKKASGSSLENLFKRLPTEIPSTQNLMAFMFKFHSNYSAINTIARNDAYRTQLISKIMKMRLAISRNSNIPNRLLKLKAIDTFLANLLEGMYGGKYPLVIAAFMQKAGKSVAYVERSDEEFEKIYRYIDRHDSFDDHESEYTRPTPYPTGSTGLAYMQTGFKEFFGKTSYPVDDDENLNVLQDLYQGLENKQEVLDSYLDKSSDELHRNLLFVSIRDWFDYVPWEKIYTRLDRSATLFTTLTVLGNINVENYFSNSKISQEILMALSLLRMLNVRDLPPDIPNFCKVIVRIETLLEKAKIGSFNTNYLHRVRAQIARDRRAKAEDIKLLQETIQNCPNILRAFSLDDDE